MTQCGRSKLLREGLLSLYGIIVDGGALFWIGTRRASWVPVVSPFLRALSLHLKREDNTYRWGQSSLNVIEQTTQSVNLNNMEIKV